MRRSSLLMAWWLLCALLPACAGKPVSPLQPGPAATQDPVALFNRALDAHRRGEAEKAIGLYTQVIAVAPAHAAPHTNLGILYRQAGRLDDAVAEYAAAVDLDPRDAWAFHNLGIAQRQRGAWRDAERAYLRALDVRPSQIETHYNLAVLYELFLDQPDKALTHYRFVVSQGGELAELVAPWIKTLERRLAAPERP